MAVLDFGERRVEETFLESLRKNKYIDLILLCMLILAFLILIIASATPT